MFINIKSILNNVNYKNHHLSRKVLQINPLTLNFNIWESASAASNALKLELSHICRVCNGENRQFGGYLWRYYDDFINKQYVRCNENLKCDILDLLPGGNLCNYIKPCFIPLSGEIFIDIVGYNGLYKVSNFGRVISLLYNPFITLFNKNIDSNGYVYINLRDKNNIQHHYSIHRLVAKAFIPNPNNYPEVNHKDEIKTNNFVDNLEWCTHEYNMNYSDISTKAAEALAKPIEQIDISSNKIIKEFKSINDASRITGISITHISRACNTNSIACGFKWRFKNQ